MGGRAALEISRVAIIGNASPHGQRLSVLVQNVNRMATSRYLKNAALPQPPAGSYHHVQGLARGLEVLCALNRRRSGTASAVELSEATGLNRSTVKRLLETLRASGFVQPLTDGRNYTVTFRVQQLSEGFDDESGLCAVARPLLQNLTEKVLWPSDLVSLEGDHLVIRYSTHSFSSLSFHTGTIGDHFPLLPTSAGRAYLAFCPNEERELLLEMLCARKDVQGELARDKDRVRLLLQATRERGYGVNDGDWMGQPAFGALAAPIRYRRRVLACVNIIFSRRAVTLTQAMSRYGDELLAAAQQIEGQFKAAQRSAI